MILQYTQRWLGLAGRMTAFIPRFCLTVTETFQQSRFLYHARGKCRRFLLAHLQKGYVMRQRQFREGSCRQCGTCCNLLITCPRLTKNSDCLAYGTCRPEVCKIFPIDQRDIEEVAICGARCGFHFTAEVSPKRRWWALQLRHRRAASKKAAGENK